uniref:Nuclear receptor n=1 Tax=Pristionchus pacificus TaxID=54126 RepID=A0A2A6C4E9_PRIPA|eukprot:PDM72996.1 nuclear receptor [Pristionchus pacificus]
MRVRANTITPLLERIEKEFKLRSNKPSKNLSISEDAEQLIDNIRHEIFENLQSYYQNELGLTDFSVRLGNLMSLNHTIQECHSLFKVAMRFFSSVFDLHMTEKSMEAIMI